MTPAKSGKTCDRADALAVVRTLREAGHVAYFAGGCVRDLLLGLDPKDYDVATDAPPDRVRQLFPRTQAVGAAFGVILVRQGRSQIEVATFRTDGKRVKTFRMYLQYALLEAASCGAFEPSSA